MASRWYKSPPTELVRWVILLGVTTILAEAHVSTIDRPWMEQKLQHHTSTLANSQPNPYQYKFWTISWAMEGIHRATGIGLDSLYIANTCLGLLALILAHDAWLRKLYGPGAALLGTLLLGALAHGLFRKYYHHPYDFWGVAMYCLLLRAVVAGRGMWAVAGLAMATGLVWEKHVLVPLLAGARKWKRGENRIRTVVWTTVTFVAAMAGPVAVRLICGTDRPEADITPLARQSWHHLPYATLPFIVPPLLAGLAVWKRLSDWVRWLWWYVPAMYIAYAVSQFTLFEPRSFWALVPIYTATIAGWAALQWLRPDTSTEAP